MKIKHHGMKIINQTKMKDRKLKRKRNKRQKSATIAKIRTIKSNKTSDEMQQKKR